MLRSVQHYTNSAWQKSVTNRKANKQQGVGMDPGSIHSSVSVVRRTFVHLGASGQSTKRGGLVSG